MAKKVTAKAPAKVKITAASKVRSKSEMLNAIAESTQLSRKQVSAVFDSLSEVIRNDLGKKGPQLVTVPGLMKISVVRKPATKERKGINPFTGEETTFKAKPARNVVKIRALKGLKAMV